MKPVHNLSCSSGVTEIPAGCYSVPQSRPGSRQSCNSTESETMPLEPEVAQALQDELTSSQSWQNSISLDDRYFYEVNWCMLVNMN